MGGLPALLLVAAAAAPAADAFRFDGPSASAQVNGGAAVLRMGQEVRPGTGHAFLRGEDRVRERELTYGDAGELWLRVSAGKDVYRVELDAVGFPPEAALPAAKRSWWGRGPEAPRRPEQAVEGGVMLGRTVNGDSGLGVAEAPARRAVVALWGVGRLYRNDALVAPRARILAQGFRGGLVTPEGSLRAAAPSGDPELDVFVDHLPPGVSRSGYLHFALDGAAFQEAAARPAVARKAAEPPAKREARETRESRETRETREEKLSRRPTVDEQWDTGLGMLVWREEKRPAAEAPPAPPPEAPGVAEIEEPVPVASEAQPALAPAPAPAPAYAPPEGTAPAQASAPAPSLPAGTLTVLVPPPPLMNVPATPLTAPIQYESGQNGGTIGTGGGGFPVAGYGGGALPGGAAPGTGTGIFSQPPPSPSGVFASSAGPQAPGAPGVPSSGSPGIGGSGFASPGIPATPPVLNNGAASPAGLPGAVVPTPQPINAQPAPTPGAPGPVR
ncbi:MAG TPA: hypothetical protein VND93_28005 [Myxococcales bacterium]|nr:hypothetical protein [Myxococcales bacterium]